MKSCRLFGAIALAVLFTPDFAMARLWTDATGQYTVEAELVSFNDEVVVLKRADHEMAAIPIDKLSEGDRKFLATSEAAPLRADTADAAQTWTLRDGSTIEGRMVDYARRDLTLQRRRGRVFANDRPLQNLPEVYRRIIPMIVAHFEKLPSSDRATFDAWVLRQRGQARTFALEGVVLETANGDEYGVPFFLLSEADTKLLERGWQEWAKANADDKDDSEQDLGFLLQSLAAARQQDQAVSHEIATLQLHLQAVQAGLTALWEVTLFPVEGNFRPPQWVVVPGRDSFQASVVALEHNPGYVVGSVRRVSNR